MTSAMTDPSARPSALQLPPGPWATVYDCLCERFPHVSATVWRDRIERQRVQDARGTSITLATPHRVGLEIRYWRDAGVEARVPGEERVLHVDDHIVVADKPHFLPVAPTGNWVEETLLRRLQRRLGLAMLVPLHRLDRATEGLVLFSVNPATRAAYHALFAARRIEKTYHALAPPLPALTFPYTHRSRLVAGEPFFRIKEEAGTANSDTAIDVLRRDADHWRYELRPATGRKHQLRVHMAALGAPILGDRWYPQLLAGTADDPARPLALLAHTLRYVDPVTGEPRVHRTTLSLTDN